MKFVITEEQNVRLQVLRRLDEKSDSHEQKKWLRFEMFMRRRGEQIRDIISQHSHAYQYDVERYDEDVLMSTMLDLVVGDFCDINKIDYEDKEYDWVYFYIKDNYTDYIKKELSILDKDTITEEEGKKLKKDKWCKHIEDIVLSMDIKRLCEVQVALINWDNNKLDKEYLVILKTDYHSGNLENMVSKYINNYLPHLELIVIRLDCDNEVKITENIDRKKPLNKLFRRINPDDLIYHLDLTIYNEIEWHMRDKNVIPLEKLGETEFVYLVIEHFWEYIYDNFVESNVTYRDDEILEIKGGIQSLFGDRIRNVYRKVLEKKSLTESSSLSRKFRELIHNQGLAKAIDAIGSYEDLINIVGEELITREVKEKFIKDVVKEHGGISVFDLNEDPIFYEKTEKEYQEIAWFGLTKVTIQVWELDDMEDTREIYAPYENLSDRQIDEIFIMLVEHYIEGINII